MVCAALAAGGCTSLAAQDAVAPVHLPAEGVFVIEAENVEPAGDWARVEHPDGGHYLHYTGPNRYEAEGEHVPLTYCLQVEQPGEYQVRLRMMRSRADDPAIREDERNDLWLRMHGRHWMKLFANTPWEEWGWDGGLDFHHLNGTRPPASLVFEDTGMQCFDLAGRSEDVRLDRIHLSLGEANTDLTLDTRLSP